MSDNQSWNSSGSEEDVEPRDESGHLIGIVDLSGVLSKVSHLFNKLEFPDKLAWSMSLPKRARQGGVCLSTYQGEMRIVWEWFIMTNHGMSILRIQLASILCHPSTFPLCCTGI